MVDLGTMQGVWTFLDSVLLHSHTHYAHGITFYQSSTSRARFKMYGPPAAEQGFGRPKSGTAPRARVRAARPDPDPGTLCCHRTPPPRPST